MIYFFNSRDIIADNIAQEKETIKCGNVESTILILGW